LDIERSWGKWPGWFDTLSTEDQALLIADRTIEAKAQRDAMRKIDAQQRATKIGRL